MERDFGKISDLVLTDNVIQCGSDSTLLDCLQAMQISKIGCIVIVDTDTGKVKGIFTERDYLIKVAGKKIEIEDTPVRDFMTPNPFCMQETGDLKIAILKMRKGKFRHVVVVDENDKLKSLFSIRDILYHIIDEHSF